VSAPYSAWRRLGIEPTKEVAAIRSAYAAVLKSIDPDADPAGFEALRKAREQALAWARSADAAPPADMPAASSDRLIPLGELDASLVTPTLPEGTAPGDLAAAAPPPTDGNYRTIERPEPADGDEHVIPLQRAHDALTPPVLGGSSASSTLESRPLAAPQAREAHYRALLRLLFGEEGRFESLTDETVRREMVTHAEALLRDPQMVEIGFYAEAERWFARIVAGSAPRSDPIVHLVLDQFGWLADRGRFDQPPEAAAVVARYDMLAFHAAVQRPDHPLFRAWQELITPAGESSRRGRVDKKKIHELLLTVRRDHPALEQEFDWYRVSLWENPPAPSSRGSGSPWVTIAVFMVVLLGQLGRCGGAPSPPTINPSIFSGPTMNGPIDTPVGPRLGGLLDSDDDIAAALHDVAGDDLTIGALKEKNPVLAGMLATNWRLAREFGESHAAFVRETSTLLFDRYNRGLERADYGLIAEQRKLDLDETRAALKGGASICARYFERGLPIPLSVPFLQRRNALIARTLLETNGDPRRSPAASTYTIPGEVIDEVEKRSGMSRSQFLRGLSKGALPQAHCKARIALLEAALALPPRTSLKMLQEM
jgi:hypothetical protein